MRMEEREMLNPEQRNESKERWEDRTDDIVEQRERLQKISRK